MGVPRDCYNIDDRKRSTRVYGSSPRFADSHLLAWWLTHHADRERAMARKSLTEQHPVGGSVCANKFRINNVVRFKRFARIPEPDDQASDVCLITHHFKHRHTYSSPLCYEAVCVCVVCVIDSDRKRSAPRWQTAGRSCRFVRSRTEFLESMSMLVEEEWSHLHKIKIWKAIELRASIVKSLQLPLYPTGIGIGSKQIGAQKRWKTSFDGTASF